MLATMLPQRRPMASPNTPNTIIPATTQKCIGKSQGDSAQFVFIAADVGRQVACLRSAGRVTLIPQPTDDYAAELDLVLHMCKDVGKRTRTKKRRKTRTYYTRIFESRLKTGI
jgi:hypothetical protein